MRPWSDCHRNPPNSENPKSILPLDQENVAGQLQITSKKSKRKGNTLIYISYSSISLRRRQSPPSCRNRTQASLTEIKNINSSRLGAEREKGGYGFVEERGKLGFSRWNKDRKATVSSELLRDGRERESDQRRDWPKRTNK